MGTEEEEVEGDMEFVGEKGSMIQRRMKVVVVVVSRSAFIIFLFSMITDAPDVDHEAAENRIKNQNVSFSQT